VPIDAWLPIGHSFPDGGKSRLVLQEGEGWQIFEVQGGGRALVVREELAAKWIARGLVDASALTPLTFGDNVYRYLPSDAHHLLASIGVSRSPANRNEALAFAAALKATRAVDPDTPLQDALFVEKISRLLPTYTITSRTPDDVVLGYWLTGGASVSATAFRRLSQIMSWMPAAQLKEVVETAGFQVSESGGSSGGGAQSRTSAEPASEPAERGNEARVRAEPRESRQSPAPGGDGTGVFRLPGRPELETFFTEHVVDIVQNAERYKALGIDFPSAIVLHGPPGCGKTFAVERLIDFLGWPSFNIDASSVASAYIHETSRKVAEVFENAMKNAPSVVVIDEMEAFLADREMGSGSSHHRVEEVAEFLRRIPEAARNQVLIVAMTNRIDMIDPAILRRGRFDHIINVGFASEEEVRSLWETLMAKVPTDGTIDPAPFVKELAGRPLSDVTFVVREGARLAARGGKAKLDEASLRNALKATPTRAKEEKRKIGFV
jgi:hypothetical protein